MKTAKQQFLDANLRDGEVYGGIVLGQNGDPDYHLFAQKKFLWSATFDEVKKYVEKVGGVGATRRDLALLRVNAPEPFGTKIFWSCDQHASISNCKSLKLCGVAVRKVVI